MTLILLRTQVCFLLRQKWLITLELAKAAILFLSIVDQRVGIDHVSTPPPRLRPQDISAQQGSLK